MQVEFFVYSKYFKKNIQIGLGYVIENRGEMGNTFACHFHMFFVQTYEYYDYLRIYAGLGAGAEVARLSGYVGSTAYNIPST